MKNKKKCIILKIILYLKKKIKKKLKKEKKWALFSYLYAFQLYN